MQAQRATILIVEDDDDLRRLYRTALFIAGFIVEEAADGPDALRRIEQLPPDLVILDLLLPTLNGLAVQQEIAAHAHTQHIPVVIVTGSTISVDQLDVPSVLRKPVSPEELVEAVETCLHLGARRIGS